MPRGPILFGHTGASAGMTFDVVPPTTLGRAADCSIGVQDDQVSRHHCVIRYDDHEYVLRDLGSANGTFLNEKRINNVVALRHGDNITVGDTTFEFRTWGTAKFNLEGAAESIVASAQLSLDSPPFDKITEASGAEKLARALSKYKLLYQANEIISRIENPDRFFSLVLDHIFEILRADNGVVLLGNRIEDVQFVAVRGEQKATSPQLCSSTVLRRVLDNRESLLIVDTMLDERLYGSQSMLATSARSIMCAPMVHGQSVFGAIHIDSQRESGAFDEDDLQLLAAIAGRAAVAIEAVQLEKRHTEELTRLQLRRFLPAKDVENLVIDCAVVPTDGAWCDAIVLHAIIHSLLKPSPEVPLPAWLAHVNEIIDHLTSVIFKHGGTLVRANEKAVAAIWGPPFADPQDAALPVRCALEMQKALTELNAADQKPAGAPTISIGLNRGEVVVGNVGTKTRTDYTATGPVVDLAEQIAAQCRAGEILFSQQISDMLASQKGDQAWSPREVKELPFPAKLFAVS